VAQENEVYVLSKRFSLRIIRLYKYLTNEKNEYILSKQVLKSGTSIGANISEAQMAQSKADFIAKMQVALKECNETKYWLELLYQAEYIPENAFYSIYADCCSLLRLLIVIIKTGKDNIPVKGSRHI
jgi:four helix bundle protein